MIEFLFLNTSIHHCLFSLGVMFFICTQALHLPSTYISAACLLLCLVMRRLSCHTLTRHVHINTHTQIHSEVALTSLLVLTY